VLQYGSELPRKGQEGKNLPLKLVTLLKYSVSCDFGHFIAITPLAGLR
jgi:hypothetical protein